MAGTRASTSRQNASSSAAAGPSGSHGRTSNPTRAAQQDELMAGPEGEEALEEDSEELEIEVNDAEVAQALTAGARAEEDDEDEEEEVEMPLEGEEEYGEWDPDAFWASPAAARLALSLHARVQQADTAPPVRAILPESESTSQTGTDSLTWISWYCSLPGHEYFAEVTDDFIEDDFNLTGLSQLVPFYKEALEMVLDVEPEEEALKIPDMSIVESSAELLYGLIHQRYIITRQGLQQMVAKYEAAHFGYCPRVFCNQTKVLPSGRSDLPGVDGVKLFCPNCLDTYTPPSSRFNGVDGAFFGTTFPHLLFQQHPELVPPLSNAASAANTRSPTASPSPNKGPAPEGNMRTDGDSEDETDDKDKSVPWTTPATSAARLYIPRIYGFKVSERARSGPRMHWLRMRPSDLRELDRVDSHGRWKVSTTEESRPPATARQVGGLRSPPGTAGASATATKAVANSTSNTPTPTGTATAAKAEPAQQNVRQSRSRQKLNPNVAATDGDTLPPRKSYSNTPTSTTPRGRDGQSPSRQGAAKSSKS